jgi:hypothetical protein
MRVWIVLITYRDSVVSSKVSRTVAYTFTSHSTAKTLWSDMKKQGYKCELYDSELEE